MIDWIVKINTSTELRQELTVTLIRHGSGTLLLTFGVFFTPKVNSNGNSLETLLFVFGVKILQKLTVAVSVKIQVVTRTTKVFLCNELTAVRINSSY